MNAIGGVRGDLQLVDGLVTVQTKKEPEVMLKTMRMVVKGR